MEERYRIHAAYILTILITVIIVLLTIQWSGIPDLAEKLTFALTVLSVVVSLAAIAYAVHSRTGETNELRQFVSEVVALKPASEKEKRATSEIADTFIEKSPAIGLLILYSYSLATEQSKPLDINELFSTLNSSIDPRFVQGFIYATRAAGFIDSRGADDKVEVTYVNENLRHYLKDNLGNFLEELPNKFIDTDKAFEEVKKLNQDKRQIEAYFNLH